MDTGLKQQCRTGRHETEALDKTKMVTLYCYLTHVCVCVCFPSGQMGAARCTGPSPCPPPPCIRGGSQPPTPAPPTASRPIATASPATPTASWPRRGPPITWPLSAMDSPHRCVCVCVVAWDCFCTVWWLDSVTIWWLGWILAAKLEEPLNQARCFHLNPLQVASKKNVCNY